MAKWLELCPQDMNPDKAGRILLCSRHFRRDQYLNINAKRPKLVHDAVPFMKRNIATSNLKVTETQTSTPITSRKITAINHGNQQPLNQTLHQVWIPLQEEMEEVAENQMLTVDKELNDNEISEEEALEASLVVEVDMQDSDCEPYSLSSSTTPSLECSENLQEDPFTKNISENQAVVLENIHLKLDNGDLQNELDICRQRLAFLERHVHSLSKLAVGCECICNSCINSTDN